MSNHITNNQIETLITKKIKHSAAGELFEHWKNCETCQQKIRNEKRKSLLYKGNKEPKHSHILQRNANISGLNIECFFSKFGIQKINLSNKSTTKSPPQSQTNNKIFQEFIKTLDEYFQGNPINFTKIDPQLINTDFRRKVLFWTWLIPCGKTINYGKIAKWIECNSAQAIGQALKNNPLPLIIPCHRVVGKNGDLTGFASGLEVKKRLLEIENVINPVRRNLYFG